MLARHCFQRNWPLTAQGGGQAPSYVSNDYIRFNLNDIPSLTLGRLANYLPAICLTIYGSITCGTTFTGVVTTWEDLMAGLFADFDMPGCFHGRPVNNQAFRGPTARIWELIAMGYQPGARRLEWLWGSSSGARTFRAQLYIPLAFLLGDDPIYSAQLSCMYKQGQLVIHTAGVGTTLPNGNVISAVSANVRATACLIPQARVALAPAQEWIEYVQAGSSSGSAPVQLISFGDVTSLDGVQPGAGVDTLLSLCNVDSIGGFYTADQLTQLSVSFLEQTETQHMDVFMHEIERTSGFGQRPHDNAVFNQGDGTNAPTLAGQVDDMGNFPYANNPSVASSRGIGRGQIAATLDPAALCVPLGLVAGARLQVTKIPVFTNTVQYNRYLSGSGSYGTVDRTLSHQFKSWTPAFIGRWLDFVGREGILNAVLGTNSVSPLLATNDQTASVDMSTSRFLPIEYQAAAAPKAA